MTSWTTASATSRYVSQEGGPSQGDANRRDYGYVAAFKGPAGNRIVVIAGDRDTGLQQAAEALANPEALKALAKAAGGGRQLRGALRGRGHRPLQPGRPAGGRRPAQPGEPLDRADPTSPSRKW